MKPSLRPPQDQLSVIAELSLQDPAARVRPVPFEANDVITIVKKCLI